ncbi:uncharacterized transmembrane protein DDB_G0289901-like [Anopheles moucheti]|uniref:uncharacterized transmembrane protein DDB_G0289901-like n=1 Tax=Anopheles moucheti TaxID=186751 RepID=UPI0022F05798|nr:uncharacterized transmembrane protein DDB_G0289901-like [Anopheles moucheti]
MPLENCKRKVHGTGDYCSNHILSRQDNTEFLQLSQTQLHQSSVNIGFSNIVYNSANSEPLNSSRSGSTSLAVIDKSTTPKAESSDQKSGPKYNDLNKTSLSVEESNLNFNFVKSNGKSVSANNCSGSYKGLASGGGTNNGAGTSAQPPGQGGNYPCKKCAVSNNLSNPPTLHLGGTPGGGGGDGQHYHHVCHDPSHDNATNSLKNSPAHGGSGSSGRAANIIASSAPAKSGASGSSGSGGGGGGKGSTLISSCQGSFHSLQGGGSISVDGNGSTLPPYGHHSVSSSGAQTASGGSMQHACSNLLSHHQVQPRLSYSTSHTDSPNGSGTVLYNRSRINSHSNSATPGELERGGSVAGGSSNGGGTKHQQQQQQHATNYNVFSVNYERKSASIGGVASGSGVGYSGNGGGVASGSSNGNGSKTINNSSNKSNNSNGAINASNSGNSYSYHASDISQLRNIIELNKQVNDLNSKNVEYNRQLSAPAENNINKSSSNCYSNSVYNLFSNHILPQYHSNSPNTNSLNRAKKKRSYKLNGR